MWTLPFGHHEDRKPDQRLGSDARRRTGVIHQELAVGEVETLSRLGKLSRKVG